MVTRALALGIQKARVNAHAYCPSDFQPSVLYDARLTRQRKCGIHSRRFGRCCSWTRQHTCKLYLSRACIQSHTTLNHVEGFGFIPCKPVQYKKMNVKVLRELQFNIHFSLDIQAVRRGPLDFFTFIMPYCFNSFNILAQDLFYQTDRCDSPTFRPCKSIIHSTVW